MALQSSKGISGLAKQSARGTIATNPTFAFGLSGGALISVEPTQSALEVTNSKRTAYNMFREAVVNGADLSTYGYLKSLGLLLLGAIGTDTVTGTSPYVHTYSTGDLPYLSVFGKGVDANNEAVRDCKVDELTLKWDGSKPVEVSAKLAGTVFSYPSTFTATTDETASESYLIPTGGTFQYSATTGTPVDARIVGGELSIKNNVSAVDPSATLEAYDQVEGMQEHTLKLTIIPDDLNDFRATITGSTSGSSAASTVPTGSINLVFKEANGGSGLLTVTASKVAFTTAFPDADPKGGAVQIELAGIAVMPSGGTAPVVYALSNAQASY